MNQRQQDELLQFLQARQNFYGLLRLLLSKPENKTGYTDLNLDELTDISHGGQMIVHFLNEDNMSLEDIRWEYSKLFEGPRKLIAPPWESVFTSDEGLLYGRSTFQVREFYKTFGVQFENQKQEPDDHILIELEFMSYLIGQSIEAAKTNSTSFKRLIEGQHSFLQNHLAKWIPLFTDAIIKGSTCTLFIGIAHLLNEYITDDLETTKEILELI